jgi:hypothetical protein
MIHNKKTFLELKNKTKTLYKMSTKQFLFLTALVSFLISCSKDSSPENENNAAKMPLLHKVVITNPDKSLFTEEYFYNNKNNLAKAEFSSSQYTWKAVADFEYDNNSNLSRATYKTVNDSNQVMETVAVYNYSYANNQLVKQTITPVKPGHDGNNQLYTYDSMGRLIADSVQNRHTLKVDRYFRYHWDGQNNMVRKEDYIKNNSGEFSLVSFWEYKYDNKQNPYLVTPIFFGLQKIAPYLSKNNMTELRHGGSPSDNFVNEYDTSGLLQKVSRRPLANMALISTFELIYY